MWSLFIGHPLKTDLSHPLHSPPASYISIPSKLQHTLSYSPSMAASLSAATATTSFRTDCRISNSFHLITQKPISISAPISLHLSPIHRSSYFQHGIRRSDNTKSLTVCFVLDDRKLSTEVTEVVNDKVMISTTELMTNSELQSSEFGDEGSTKVNVLISEKLKRKRSERVTYLIAAVMSSFGITSMAVMAVYYRFYWQMEGAEVPLTEMFGTFALSVGAAVGMEFWARWAHKALWHASLWHMHESHHKPRDGPFELNDVFAIINAVPAVALLNYGFFHRGLIPGLCFGAGLGITVFGMAYMFVHDGLVHKRFSVGPIANVPYFRKVAAAHQLHHTDKFNGVPYGLFLGPKEVEEVGGQEELDKEINRRIKLSKGS